MNDALSSLRQNCNLLCEITKSTMKVQNEGSYAGILWYLLGPILLIAVIFAVFYKRLGDSVEHYPLYLLLGMILWHFFSDGTGRSINSIFSSAGIIKSLPVRRELFVLSSVIVSFISNLIEICVFFIILFSFGIMPKLVLLFVPILLLSFLFTLGMSLLLAAVYPYVRDLNQIWSVVTKAWWFATPVFYEMTPAGPGSRISIFNPMYHIIHNSREILIYNRLPDIEGLLLLSVFSMASLAAGYLVFRKLSARVSELL